MKKRSSILIALFCAVLLGMVSPSFAATWYVNTATGNDTWTGVNPTNVPAGTGPKKTIQAMVNGTLAAGDIISIAAGTYNEQVVVTDKSITLQGAGVGSTIIQPAAWAGLSTYSDATNIVWTGATKGRLPGNSFRPVIYVNASNTNFTVNIKGLTVDGNSVQTGNAEFLVGIMYKNAQGRVGGTATSVCGPYDVSIINCRRTGAPGAGDTTLVGFGVAAMGNSVVNVTNCLINNFQNAAVLSLGRTTNTLNRNLQPNPVVEYCRITGFDRNTQANTSASYGTSGINAGYMAVFGGRGTVRYNFIDGCTNAGNGIGAGIALVDAFTHTIGGNNRSFANTVTANEVGLYFERQVVPSGLFPPTFTIQNNTFAYNGNGQSGAGARGGVLLNDRPAGAYTLNVSQNAWGNASASTIYTLQTPAVLNPTAGFFTARTFPGPIPASSGIDGINRGSAQAANVEYVSCNLPACDDQLGYVNFPTIQKAVDAAAINVLNPTIVNIASCNYAENVVVQKPLKLHGDTLSSCGGGTKPVINPPSGNALEISSTASTTTQNVTVNGVYFKQAGTQRVGILVVGHDNTNAASNRPPQDVSVRNSCFEGYATQAANGDDAIASAAMATEEYPFNNTGRQSYGGAVPPATANVSDVDASANNNFNYLALSTDNDFKLWEKTDGFIDEVAYNIARIIKTDIIIIYCGDDMEAVLNSLGTGPVTVYLQGDCIYKASETGMAPLNDGILTINGNFDIKVDYTGRVQLPPVVVAKNGIRYSNGATAGINWDTDCTVPTKPGIRFITRDVAGMPDPDNLTNGHQPSGTVPNTSATYMKTLTPVNYGVGGFDYEVANYGYNRPTDIAVDASENGALLDAVSHIADSNGFAGTVTLDNGALFTTPLTLAKRIRFHVAGLAITSGMITILNKQIGAGPCFAPWGNGAINGIVDTRLTPGSVFYSPTVQVGIAGSAAVTDRADNTDTTNTIQQGLQFTQFNGTCTVNYRGNYTGQAPEMYRGNVTLTSDDATNFVGGNSGAGSPLASITLNGSGPCAGPSDIIRFDVPIVYMANSGDCIQTALGNTMGNQDEEGVGNDNGAGVAVPAGATPRTGTVAFTYGGATAASQTLTLDKDVKFDGDNTTANTNAGSLTMRLGAYGNPNTIVNSDNFCNSTVNVTQETGSTYTTIPDIQDGIMLACASGTVNVGNGITVAAAATPWGAGTDTYNRDNTINKSLTVQGLNNSTECANDPAFVIDAATAWGTNAARINTATFSTFTANNPVFTLASGVNNITLRGFDFSAISNGAATAVIAAPGTGAGANNTVTINNNFITNSSERFIYSEATGTVATFHSTWNVNCNRMIVNVGGAQDHYVELKDHTGTTFERNYYDGTGGSGAWATVFRGLGGATTNNIRRNVIQNVFGAANLYIGGSTNPVGNVDIRQNRFRNPGSTLTSNIMFDQPQDYVASINVANNFINGVGVNDEGIYLFASSAITHQFFTINNNSFENNTVGIRYSPTYSGTVCQINARGNWWENVSGPTTTWNPLNPTPCTAAAFGDEILQNGTCSNGDQSMISFIPWWTLGTDADGATDGWQQPAAANVLARVVRTNAAGTWLSNHATIQAGATAIAANNERVIAIQGIWGHLPIPGLGDDWGEYFSEEVSYDGNAGNYEDNEFRGTSIKAYDCTAATMRTWHTYLVGTNNVNGPVPSGDGVAHAPAVTIDGLEETGFYINGSGGADADGTMIRNFRIQGFSSVAGSLAGLDGQGIIFDQVDAPDVDACWVEGSNNAGSSSVGIYFDRCTNGTIRSTMIGHNKDISGSQTGIGIMLADRTTGNVTFGPNTVGQNAATAFASALGLGITNGNNIIRNCERIGINVGFGLAGTQGSMGATVLQYNTVRGIRDSKGLTSSAAVAAIVGNATGGSLTVNNNTIGGKGLQTSTESDNNVDIELFSNAFTFSGTNNIFRDSALVDGQIDGESHVVRSVSGGARGAEFRTFFNPASGNTFSHAVILTRDGRAPWDFSGSFNRNQDVVAISGAVHIHRAIQPSLSNTSTVFSAGSETYDNVVEIRENAGWNLGEFDQYYFGNVTFPSTTGRMHQTILGPAVANGLNTTSAHIISEGPGLAVAVTADGAENKYIRGGIVMHAVGNGLYGRISTGAANKGDVYLQRAGVGGDAGFVQFAYGATFGTQALVAGTGVETTGNNSNTDKPTIIKAGLDDANDDTYTNTTAQNRRTGVFQAGNGTAFTRETEPTALAGGNTVLSITPNPTTGTDVTVTFRVPYEGMVKVALYNALGQKVTDLRNDVLSSGVYSARFDVNNLVNGQYYVRFETEYFSMSQPVSIIK
jgi:hypothetical protein